MCGRVFSKTNGFVVSCGGFQKQRKQGKLLRFCQRNSDNPFTDGGTHFGKIFFHFQDGGMGWLTRPRNGTFDLEHGSPGCHRPEAKEAVRRPTTKKCGSPLWRSPCLGLSFAGTGFRSFLLPIFEKVIYGSVKGGFHALLHDAHYLLFKNGLLLLLVFLLFLFLTVRGVANSHLILTSLVIFTSGISIASASALLAASLAS